MSYDVQVTLEREFMNEKLVPGFFLYNVTISLDGRTMTVKTMFETVPTEDEALFAVAHEASLADAYNTPVLFQRVFDSLYMEPELLINAFDEMQTNAQQLKYVLGDVLYNFYVNNDTNEDSLVH